MQLISDIHAAQLAGAWDCDGHIGVTRRGDKRYAGRPYYRPVVQIGQARRELLDWVVEICGVGKVYRHGRRPMYHLRLPDSAAVGFLEQILPHLILKRRQAELVIELSRSQTWNGKKMPVEVVARREAIWVELRALNRKNDGAAEYLPGRGRVLRLVQKEAS